MGEIEVRRAGDEVVSRTARYAGERLVVDSALGLLGMWLMLLLFAALWPLRAAGVHVGPLVAFYVDQFPILLLAASGIVVTVAVARGAQWRSACLDAEDEQ